MSTEPNAVNPASGTPGAAEVPQQPQEQHDKDSPGPPDSRKQLVLGFLFGIVFGFLLQKGGVAKYEVLMGQFLLTDFTVVKIILTAIVVGMVGIFSMHAMGLVKLHVKPARYASNITGGLLFGVGMGVLGYCPGTAAAALGQGNYDAIPGMVGLMAGSYIYAETSNYLSGTIQKIGSRGRIMLPQIFGIRLGVFLVIFVPLLVSILFVLQSLTS